jgi:hypothetical protein
MGTHSRIAIRNEDGTFDSIYCHWDGYPNHVGVILRDHYTSPDKVRELIALGDLSSLGKEIGERHAFGAHDGGACTFYGRDRGEEGVAAVNSPDMDALRDLTQDCGGEWLYVFNGHGWACAKGGIAFFGTPADKAPGGLESIDHWLAKQPD